MVPRVPRFPFYRPLPAGHQGESGMDRRLLKVTRLIHPSPLSSSRISFSSPSPSLSPFFFSFLNAMDWKLTWLSSTVR